MRPGFLIQIFPLMLLLSFCLPVSAAPGDKKYGPGVTDTEIKIGQTMPYSGPVSAIGTMGKANAAHFEKVNAEGGVNGRKIKLISLDDGYNPARTVEQTRKLVEQEEVLLMFFVPGAPTNTAVHSYLNGKKVPQLFVANSVSKWGEPQRFPWTMGLFPNYRFEADTYAKHVVSVLPNAKIAVLYQNDDTRKDYLQGFKSGLGQHAAKLIVAETSHEVSGPTVDSQIISLHGSGADVLMIFTTAKFAAMALRKTYDVGWRPQRYLASISASVATVLSVVGLDKTQGVVSATFLKDPTDPQWQGDRGFRTG